MANKAQIDRELRKDHPAEPLAKKFQRNSAEILKPFGFEHQASATVHFYKMPGTHTFVFICHLNGLENIPETQADVGCKELQRAMMAAFGRSPPKVRGESGN